MSCIYLESVQIGAYASEAHPAPGNVPGLTSSCSEAEAQAAVPSVGCAVPQYVALPQVVWDCLLHGEDHETLPL